MQRRTLLVAALLIASLATWAGVTDPEAKAGTLDLGSLEYLGMWTAIRWTAALAMATLVGRAWTGSGPLVRATGLALVVAGALAPWLPAVAPGLHSIGMA